MPTRVIARQLLLLRAVTRLAFVSVLLHGALTSISRVQAAPALTGRGRNSCGWSTSTAGRTGPRPCKRRRR